MEVREVCLRECYEHLEINNSANRDEHLWVRIMGKGSNAETVL